MARARSCGQTAAMTGIPDDASSLEHDRQAWIAEQRRTAPVTRRRRLVLTSVVVGVSTVVVVVAGLVGALVLPARNAVPRPSPLAEPTQGAGQVGGLLPEVTLSGPSGAAVPARTVRPSVLALVPFPSARCGSVLLGVQEQTVSYGLGLTLVVPPDAAASAPALASALGGARVRVLTDPTSSLAQTYGTGLRLVVVAADGVVVDVVDDPQPGVPLALDLTRIAPGQQQAS
jgi:hypothetical protein